MAFFEDFVVLAIAKLIENASRKLEEVSLSDPSGCFILTSAADNTSRYATCNDNNGLKRLSLETYSISSSSLCYLVNKCPGLESLYISVADVTTGTTSSELYPRDFKAVLQARCIGGMMKSARIIGGHRLFTYPPYAIEVSSNLPLKIT